MAEAYIVETARLAGGRRGGALAGWHPADMGGEVINALVDRSGIDPAAVDDVIVGCVTQAGEQAYAFGRNCVMASNLPQSVPTAPAGGFGREADDDAGSCAPCPRQEVRAADHVRRRRDRQRHHSGSCLKALRVKTKEMPGIGHSAVAISRTVIGCHLNDGVL